MGLFGFLKGSGKSIGDYASEAQQANAPIVDVREPQEYQRGHIPGAENVPLGSIGSLAAEGRDKMAPIYVYCASGMRSSRACKQLKAAGFANAVNMGGISSYTGPIE